VPGHAVTQKRPFPRTINRTLTLVDRELEPLGHVAGDGGDNPLAACPRCNINVRSSNAGESHPHALKEPDVNLSAYTKGICSQRSQAGEAGKGISSLHSQVHVQGEKIFFFIFSFSLPLPLTLLQSQFPQIQEFRA